MLIFSVLFQIDQMSARRRTFSIELTRNIYPTSLFPSLAPIAPWSRLPVALACLGAAANMRASHPCSCHCHHAATANNALRRSRAIYFSLGTVPSEGVHDVAMRCGGTDFVPSDDNATRGATAAQYCRSKRYRTNQRSHWKMKNDLFDQQLNERILEGKTRKSNWTSKQGTELAGYDIQRALVWVGLVFCWWILG
jgi:hypothetical protein